MSEWNRDREKRDDAFRRSLGGEIRARAHSWQRGTLHGVVWGAVVCAIGIVLLLNHLGVISGERLWRVWPLLLVVAGAVNLTQPGKRAWGALLVAGGTLLQLDALGWIRFHWADLWPLAIIVVGLMMIWGALESRRLGTVSSNDGENSMNSTAIFGGIERRVTARDFRGGRVSAVFGGIELDFRNADFEGDQGVLEINAIFGGAEIRVPENWKVEQRSQTVFGGYTDATRLATTGDLDATKRKTLIITGTTLFGGVEITN